MYIHTHSRPALAPSVVLWAPSAPGAPSGQVALQVSPARPAAQAAAAVLELEPQEPGRANLDRQYFSCTRINTLCRLLNHLQ